MRHGLFLAGMLAFAPVAGLAAEVPAACPATPVRVVRSAGGTIDYLATVPGVPDMCRERRDADGVGDYYLGVWRSDWPGAGQAYPAIRAVMHGEKGTRTSFVTRSWPGLQYDDSFVNEGVEIVVVDGVAHRTLRVAHERAGIEGNTYHSIITSWKDLTTGVTLRTVENQIAGKSYGPSTTWQAVGIVPVP